MLKIACLRSTKADPFYQIEVKLLPKPFVRRRLRPKTNHPRVWATFWKAAGKVSSAAFLSLVENRQIRPQPRALYKTPQHLTLDWNMVGTRATKPRSPS